MHSHSHALTLMQDEAMIRQMIKGKEKNTSDTIADLIKQTITSMARHEAEQADHDYMWVVPGTAAAVLSVVI